jgi:hypothetical protein
LFLLNNPFVLAQIKGLAQRILKEAPADDEGRVQWLYQLLYARPAAKEELQLGLSALALARAGANDSEAAWEEYCQALVCANEFVYID